MKNNRLEWISGAKFIAILAVVIVHCNGLMYTNNYIAMSTSFSVTLFVLLSGIGTYLSYKNNPDRRISESLLKVLPFIQSYTIATVILYFLYKRQFVLIDIVRHLLCFDIEGTYYFVFFFLQLKLVSPFLVRWYGFCDSRKEKYLLHCISLVISFVLSVVFIKYTYTLPLYGGGKYLLGGSYFFVYYLGIVMGPFTEIQINTKQKIILFVVSLPLWFLWSVGISTYRLPFDVWLRPLMGAGDNPPSFNYIVFAIITLLICYSLFSFMAASENRIIKKLLSIIVFLGNNTLEIFLYHFAIMTLVIEFFPRIKNNVWLCRCGLFPLMILLMPSINYLLKKLKTNKSK